MLLPFLLSILVLYLPPLTERPAGPWPLVLGGVAALAVVNALVAWAGAALAIRLARVPGGRGQLAATRVFAFLKGAIVGFAVADAVALGWPALLAGWLGGARWGALAYDLLLPLPVLVMALTLMAFQHRFERRRGRMALPLARYTWLRFRVELAIVLVPWLAVILLTDVVGVLLEGSRFATAGDLAATGLLVLAVVVFGPVLLRVLWDTEPLPAGPLRARLEEFCRRERFRCRDILLWRTHRHLTNAGVAGPTPLVRYVMLTDALLQHCTEDEVEAVFAHEAGHVRHRHLPFYLLFGVGFICLYVNLLDLLTSVGLVQPLWSIFALGATAEQAVVMVAFAAAYWGVAFGWVSRRLEQQADIFALAHSTAPAAFITALGKLAAASGVPPQASSWRHFSIERRQNFLGRILADPAEAARFSRRAALMQAGLLALLAAGAARLLLFRLELFAL